MSQTEKTKTELRKYNLETVQKKLLEVYEEYKTKNNPAPLLSKSELIAALGPDIRKFHAEGYSNKQITDIVSLGIGSKVGISVINEVLADVYKKKAGHVMKRINETEQQ